MEVSVIKTWLDSRHPDQQWVPSQMILICVDFDCVCIAVCLFLWYGMTVFAFLQCFLS